MCIGGELEHHKHHHSPSWKNRALQCSACGRRVYIENCWSRFVSGTDTKGTSLVPAPAKNGSNGCGPGSRTVSPGSCLEPGHKGPDEPGPMPHVGRPATRAHEPDVCPHGT